eukprot:CAMPEP_0179377722 /NCGR_PEP_ID=MMETSP0797-20121207/88970_1 /TAXON_ID=47934 /ORGANISM="Dinophysis acuminata, Strain DAEP01" /LENGTH=66 /DNA_ID=CAMNT_0021093779 /DNA_START=26 /DNA_END=223 /DNA_ORIENTATION=+
MGVCGVAEYRGPRSLLLRQVPEGGLDLVVRRREDLLEVLLRLAGQLELHVRDLLDEVLHGGADRVP